MAVGAAPKTRSERAVVTEFRLRQSVRDADDRGFQMPAVVGIAVALPLGIALWLIVIFGVRALLTAP